MPDEREVKLEASPQFARPDLGDVSEGISAAEPVQRRLNTIYWDTPDLRLARWGCSLRYRAGEGWTVKLPASLDGLVMIRAEHAFAGPAARPPADALDLLRAFVRSAALGPVAHLQTRRVSVSLKNAEGAEMAEVDDDEVSVLDGRRVAARFRQLEVEVKSPTTNGLVASVVSRLRDAGAAPDPVPKHVRALGPRASAPPEINLTPIDAEAPAGNAIRHAIGASVVRLLQHDAAVRIGGDIESVHQARVATRRLRSDLRTFATLFEPDFIGSLREELRWIGDLLGEVRDADVLRARMQVRLKERGGGSADGQLLLQRLSNARVAARVQLLQGLRSPRYVELLDRLVAASMEPPLSQLAQGSAREVMLPMAERPWDRLRKAAEKLDKQSQDVELHAVRIAAKQCRYATEAVEPIVGKPARRFADAVAGLQQTLGDYNDAVIADQWLRRAAGDMKSSAAFVAGALSEAERTNAVRARGAWPDAWKKLSRKKMHAWLADG